MWYHVHGLLHGQVSCLGRAGPAVRRLCCVVSSGVYLHASTEAYLAERLLAFCSNSHGGKRYCTHWMQQQSQAFFLGKQQRAHACMCAICWALSCGVAVELKRAC